MATAEEQAKAADERRDAPQWKKNLVKELLAKRPIRFPRRQIYASNVNMIWTLDLADMQRYSVQNENYRYILVVLDVFSRYAYARPLKRKTMIETTKALKEIFHEANAIPRKMWTDDGTEFKNSLIDRLCNERNIVLYSTHNTVKASIAER